MSVPSLAAATNITSGIAPYARPSTTANDSVACSSIEAALAAVLLPPLCMKNITILFATLLLLAACTQETETTTTVTETGTTQTSTTTVSTTVPELDTAATAEATREAAEAAKDAAHKTGTAMETAGKAIQEKTKTD
jgi:hypothetical protein